MRGEGTEGREGKERRKRFTMQSSRLHDRVLRHRAYTRRALGLSPSPEKQTKEL